MVPADFEVPERLDGDGFHLRPLTVGDLIKDYDAVMSSADHLVGVLNPGSNWPHGLTLETDLIDLAWHQREFRLRHSFAYTMMSTDEAVCLGCCYIYPSDDPAYDAMAFYWVRASVLAEGLDERLGAAFRGWLASDWPFKRIAYPGRDVSWDRWLGQPPDEAPS
ncbi:MAG: GNAT family N-acetyltransferase [Pseudomonadota bacterium]